MSADAAGKRASSSVGCRRWGWTAPAAVYSPAAMRIGIVGAGGVGGVLAGLLARAGNDVALVTRGAARDAIRAEGLHIDSPLGVFHARVEAGSIGELGPVDA